MTDEPPKPKRRRKPPPGLEGFDTGFPEDEAVPTADLPETTERSIPLPMTERSSPLPTHAREMPVIEAAPREERPIATAPIATPASFPTAPMEMLPQSLPPELPSPVPAATELPPTELATFEPLPPSLSQPTDLRASIGAAPEKRRRAQTPPPIDVDDDYDDEGGGKRRSRKMIMVSIASLVVGLGVAALVFLGRANSSWFYISCESDRVVAEQGRSFPPWGESELEGKQWAAIKIPPETECVAIETEDEAKLSDEFRTILVKRASLLLTAKEVTKTDEANTLLEQALLHTRSSSDASRNARTDIQRLLGDVAYWRASLKMRDASKSLLEAAKQFDAAVQQRPKHATDASGWAEYIRKVVGELESGPAGSTQTTFPPAPPPSEQRPPAPPGVALPVEPDKPAEPVATPPDAGVPTGGVLL